MAQRMHALMSENPDVTYFFAVGVYHLLGKSNLLTELKDFPYKHYAYSSLYTITRIPQEVKLEDFHISGKSSLIFPQIVSN